MTERFDCHHCEGSLFGKKYILREESPYCVACFEALYASTCEECGKPIGCDCKDRHWHEACFHCSRCKSSLVDKPFAAKEDQLLCTDCYSHEYSSKCQECRKTIMPGTRKMEYKGSSWHETCFICHRCQQPIGTKSFIPKDGQNFCVPCYEKQYALQCVQCKKLRPTRTPLISYSVLSFIRFFNEYESDKGKRGQLLDKASVLTICCIAAPECSASDGEREALGLFLRAFQDAHPLTTVSAGTNPTLSFKPVPSSTTSAGETELQMVFERIPPGHRDLNSPSPPGASRTGSSRGTGSASCAPPARSRCPGSASRPETSLPTA
uniref:Four and a half LIM domains 2 n=1 Tax=Equus asinus TaxID=9793 RepID=A0A9L0J2S0_EQUAS